MHKRGNQCALRDRGSEQIVIFEAQEDSSTQSLFVSFRLKAQLMEKSSRVAVALTVLGGLPGGLG